MSTESATENPQMTVLLRTWGMVDTKVETSAAVSAASPNGTTAVLRLSEVLDLKAAAPLAAELLTLRGRSVRLDASQVQRIGGLCLQVLLSMCRTWRVDGASLSIVNPSARFIEGIALLGASAALSLEA